MSIGGEDTKGNEITKDAFSLLKGSPLNFRGNVEGHDLFRGETDVVVCDGFVGNIVLKTSESVAHAIGHWLKQEFRANPLRLLGPCCCGGTAVDENRMDPNCTAGLRFWGEWRLYHHARGLLVPRDFQRRPGGLRLRRQPPDAPDRG